MDKGNLCKISLFFLSAWLWVLDVCDFPQHTEALISCFPAFPCRGNFPCKAVAESSSIESATFLTKSLLSREEAQSFIHKVLIPQDLYGDRVGMGRDAHGIEAGSTAFDANDPRLSMTYAEFPLSSLDHLIDLGLHYMTSLEVIKSTASPFTCIDLGSGCGRIGLYLAMTRGGTSDGTEISSKPWKVNGIEISDILHHEALGYCQKAVENDLISPSSAGSTIALKEEMVNTLSFHLGPAENFGSLLSQADCIFAYSTVFAAKVFSPELGALILGPEWSQMLAKSCKDGCMAITTDRALDPAYGWQLIDRLDVENREVFGTTGYVHILKK